MEVSLIQQFEDGDLLPLLQFFYLNFLYLHKKGIIHFVNGNDLNNKGKEKISYMPCHLYNIPNLILMLQQHNSYYLNLRIES